MIDWRFNRTLVMGMILGMIVAGRGITESLFAGAAALATVTLLDIVIAWLRQTNTTTKETPHA